MNPEQHARAKGLFSKAQGLEKSQVPGFLLAECPDDEEVRAEVLSLLEFDRPETILLESDKQGAATTVIQGPVAGRNSAQGIATRFRRRGNRLKLWAILTFVALVGLGVFTHRHVQSSIDHMVRSQIETLLKSTVSALRILFRNESERMDRWVRHPDLVQATETLLAAARKKDGDLASLRGSSAQTEIHELLDPLLDDEEYLGFALISPSGRFLSGTERLVSDLIGQRVKSRVSEFMERVKNAPKGMSGALLARPIAPLSQARAKARVTARSGTEILPLNFLTVWGKIADYRPETGEERILGVLVLLVRPDMDFSRLLMDARVGATGETYAFDQEGFLLSESRFAEDLPALGLMPRAENGVAQSAIFAFKIRDPGRLLSPEQPLTASEAKTLPRTKMHRLAVEDRDGGIHSSLIPYRDYRGQSVVGAWTWLSEYGFGLTTEIDSAEAFAPVYWVRGAFLALFGLLLVALLFVLSSRFSILRMQKKVDEAQQIGPYKLERKIGEGGIGEVYLATHALLRRPTAIKVLKQDCINLETLQRFETEVQQTSRLTHPNTIEIFDYGHTPEGTFYHAMEYLPGFTMADLIRIEGPIEPRRAVHLLDQVCASLSEAHAKGLIHRDIKPQNIMLCERGGIYDTVKVLDFGLVKDLAGADDAQLTAPNQLGGTPMYIAPERIKDPSRNDALTDLYSVGTVAFNLLTGRNPFDASNSLEIVASVMNKPAPQVNDIEGIQVPEALNRLVARLLSKNPEDRPQSADQLRLELASLALPPWTSKEAELWWKSQSSRLTAD